MTSPPDNPANHARADVVRITPAEFKRHLRQTSQFVLMFCLLVVSFVAVNIGFDVHAMRRQRADELSELIETRKGIFSRLDSLLWRMDTQAEVIGVTNKILADALVKMRAQVKESTDTGVKTATATTAIAREAVKQSAATTQLVEAVTDTDKPIVRVEVPKPAPPVVVQAPVAPAPHPATPQTPRPPAEAHHRRRPWYRRVLPWEWFAHGSA